MRSAWLLPFVVACAGSACAAPPTPAPLPAADKPGKPGLPRARDVAVSLEIKKLPDGRWALRGNFEDNSTAWTRHYYQEPVAQLDPDGGAWVLVATDRAFHHFYRIDADGKETWWFQLNTKRGFKPEWLDGRRGRVAYALAHNHSDARDIWMVSARIDDPEPQKMLASVVSPVAHAGGFVGANDKGEIIGLDETGAEQWRAHVAFPNSDRLAASPRAIELAVHDDMVIAQLDDGGITAIGAGGQIHWRRGFRGDITIEEALQHEPGVVALAVPVDFTRVREGRYVALAVSDDGEGWAVDDDDKLYRGKGDAWRRVPGKSPKPWVSPLAAPWFKPGDDDYHRYRSLAGMKRGVLWTGRIQVDETIAAMYAGIGPPFRPEHEMLPVKVVSIRMKTAARGDDIAICGGGHCAARRGGIVHKSELDGKLEALGFAGDALVAVGDRIAVLGTDNVWRSLPDAPLGKEQHGYGVWGTSASDLWISLGHNAEGEYWVTPSSHDVAHFDGKTWTRHTLSHPVGPMWGRAGDDIYALGQEGLAHYDGKRWAHVVGTPDDVTHIAGAGETLLLSGPSGLWAARKDPQTTFAAAKPAATPPPAGRATAAKLGAADPRRLKAVDIGVKHPQQIVAGDGGALWLHDGDKIWQRKTETTRRLNAERPSTECFACLSKDGLVIGKDGVDQRIDRQLLPYMTAITGDADKIWLASALPYDASPRVVSVGADGVKRYYAAAPPAHYVSIAVVDDKHIWLAGGLRTPGGPDAWSRYPAGEGIVAHFDGNVWRWYRAPAPLHAVSAIAGRGVAVGVAGTVVVIDNNAATTVELPGKPWLHGVHVESGDAWIVGERATAYRYDGTFHRLDTSHVKDGGALTSVTRGSDENKTLWLVGPAGVFSL